MKSPTKPNGLKKKAAKPTNPKVWRPEEKKSQPKHAGNDAGGEGGTSGNWGGGATEGTESSGPMRRP